MLASVTRCPCDPVVGGVQSDLPSWGISDGKHKVWEETAGLAAWAERERREQGRGGCAQISNGLILPEMVGSLRGACPDASNLFIGAGSPVSLHYF